MPTILIYQKQIFVSGDKAPDICNLFLYVPI